MDRFLHDLNQAVRGLRRDRGFTATVVMTLALAVGANTAIFSIYNALVLTTLPYPEPERLGAVYALVTGKQAGHARRTIDGEQWELLRDNVPSLRAAVYIKARGGANLQAGSYVQYLHVGRVSARFFDVLGVNAGIGRTFLTAEDLPTGERVAVISHHLSQTAFSGRGDVLQQVVMLGGEPYTVVGVLPTGAETPLNADIYIPLRPGRENEGRGTNFEAIIRLEPGATWHQADTELNRAWATSARRVSVRTAGDDVTYHTVSLQQGQTDALRPQLIGLMLASGLILLIASANLAGLSLVRMRRYRGDYALRLALGASPNRILSEWWIESLVLAIVGGAAGIGAGFFALRGLLLLLPDGFLPVVDVKLDLRVLSFTLVVSLLASVLFRIVPALFTSKSALRSSFASRNIAGGGGLRVRQGLIAGEVALTVLLLAAAGLLTRTLIHLETIPPGFNPAGVVSAKASLNDAKYRDPAAFRALLDRGLEAIRAVPGVEGAAVALTLPYERPMINRVTITDGNQAGTVLQTNQVYVTPGYFETLQVARIAGRTFADSDGADAEPVAIVNQAFARKFFGSDDPVGRYLNKNMRIIGLVADTVLSSASQLNKGSAPLTKEETLFIPAAQVADARLLAMVHTVLQPAWIVRSSGPIADVPARVQQAMARVEPALPLSGFSGMDDIMKTTLIGQRLQVSLLASMAVLALVLSALGIFALVAETVGQRTREIGIRLALGSTARGAIVDVGKPGVIASTIGLILGLGLCTLVLGALRSVLYGVETYDAVTLAAVILTLSLVTVVATVLPALRIAGIDPSITLRD